MENKNHLRNIFYYIFFSVWPFIFSNISLAHVSNLSYLRMKIQEQTIVCDLKVSLHDVKIMGNIQQEPDGTISQKELAKNEESIFKFLKEKIILINNQIPCKVFWKGFNLEENEMSLDARASVGYAIFHLEYETETLVEDLTVDYHLFYDLDTSHQCYGTIQVQNQTIEFVFQKGNIFSLQQSLGHSPNLLSQNLKFIKLGIEHIFTGYDHILFLLGLLLVSKNFWGLIKIVTSFTVAHSLTLIVATLGWVILPVQFVESTIALSIVYIAIENLVVQNIKKRWIITFIFGLVHGFGFSNVLREMGLPKKGLILSLFCFNGGVEVGQITIVSILFPLLFLLWKEKWYDRFILKGISVIISIFGLYWFFQRIIG